MSTADHKIISRVQKLLALARAGSGATEAEDAAALRARGEKQVVSRSRKYLTMTRAAGGFYFLGKSGALRFGRSSTSSIPVSDTFKRKLRGLSSAPQSQVEEETT
jgi:hypothetical protein